LGVADSPSAGLLGVLSRRRDGAQFVWPDYSQDYSTQQNAYFRRQQPSARIARLHVGGAGAWVLLGVRWVLRAWVLLARIKQVNGAMVAAVVGEPFHEVKCEIKKITRNMKNGIPT